MRNKFVSLAIIILVFTYVVASGFWILKESVATNISNGQLIAKFITARSVTTSTMPFAHLAEAVPASSLITPQSLIANDSFEEISTLASGTPSGTTASSITSSTQISQQALEVLAATLINIQMTTGSPSTH
jgi:hypothetical protein